MQPSLIQKHAKFIDRVNSRSNYPDPIFIMTSSRLGYLTRNTYACKYIISGESFTGDMKFDQSKRI